MLCDYVGGMCVCICMRDKKIKSSIYTGKEKKAGSRRRNGEGQYIRSKYTVKNIKKNVNNDITLIKHFQGYQHGPHAKTLDSHQILCKSYYFDCQNLNDRFNQV